MLDAASGKRVLIIGANVAYQCLEPELVDDIIVHMVPLLPGHGVRQYGKSAGRSVPLAPRAIGCRQQACLVDVQCAHIVLEAARWARGVDRPNWYLLTIACRLTGSSCSRSVAEVGPQRVPRAARRKAARSQWRSVQASIQRYARAIATEWLLMPPRYSVRFIEPLFLRLSFRYAIARFTPQQQPILSRPWVQNEPLFHLAGPARNHSLPVA